MRRRDDSFHTFSSLFSKRCESFKCPKNTQLLAKTLKSCSLLPSTRKERRTLIPTFDSLPRKSLASIASSCSFSEIWQTDCRQQDQQVAAATPARYVQNPTTDQVLFASLKRLIEIQSPIPNWLPLLLLLLPVDCNLSYLCRCQQPAEPVTLQQQQPCGRILLHGRSNTFTHRTYRQPLKELARMSPSSALI